MPLSTGSPACRAVPMTIWSNPSTYASSPLGCTRWSGAPRAGLSRPSRPDRCAWSRTAVSPGWVASRSPCHAGRSICWFTWRPPMGAGYPPTRSMSACMASVRKSAAMRSACIFTISGESSARRPSRPPVGLATGWAGAAPNEPAPACGADHRHSPDVLWALAAAWMTQGMRANLDRTLDGRLAMSARMVAGLLEGAALDPNASPANFTDAVRVSGKEGIACEIRALRGEVLASTGSVPTSDFATLPAGYSTREVEGRQWRVYILHDNGYQITTADRIDERNVLINNLLGAAGVPFLIAFLGGLAALWIGIGRGLAPLEALREQLRARDTDDITPIVVGRSPTELRPVLDAMNALLARLAQALASQRAFTDAAAHELRTPLTVIDTHLQVARLSDGEDAQASLASAEEGVRRLRRILDQMMTLARTEAVPSKGDECISVLAAVEEVLDRTETSQRSRLIFTMTGNDAGTPLPRSLLETALRNLVDNALRYSPEGTPIEITAAFDHPARCCVIAVADQGPGMDPEQLRQIGRRFWRGDRGRQYQDGAGLGISIVRAITTRFGGALELKPRPTGGLIAEITLPLARTNPG